MIVIRFVFYLMKLVVFLEYFIITSVNGIVLLNSSYDVSRELFTEINSNFIKYWIDHHPDDGELIIRQSHAGSTRQAMSVLQGLRADVVTYNQVSDIQILHDIGRLIPKDWQNRLPNDSSPFYSTMAFLVRKGNPKNIYDWDDLINKKVKIVFPNPKISGNGRYTYLAAWNVFFQNNDGDLSQVRFCMRKFLKNVIIFDTGGRSATSTFVDRKQGDVLINFESEMKLIQNKYNVDNYQIIVPKFNVLVEFPVTWIDKNVQRNGTQDVSCSYLLYLYTVEAQKIIKKFGYRVIDPGNIVQVYQEQFPGIKLFKIEDKYGDWKTIMHTHFKRGGEFDKLLSEGLY